MMNLALEQIIAFAAEKHKGQKRASGYDYMAHPIRVAQTVLAYTYDYEMMAAAVLHDTIEDTKTTYEEICAIFGKRVGNLVLALTNDAVEKEKLGRKAYLTNKLNSMDADTLLIKLADRLDNVTEVKPNDIEWSRKYAQDTDHILRNLNNSAIGYDHFDLIQRIYVEIERFL